MIKNSKSFNFLVIGILIISFLLTNFYRPPSLISTIKLPENWSFEDPKASPIIIHSTETGGDYYAYLVYYKGDRLKDAWLITDKNGNPVKDKNLYYKLAKTAEVSEIAKEYSYEWFNEKDPLMTKMLVLSLSYQWMSSLLEVLKLALNFVHGIFKNAVGIALIENETIIARYVTNKEFLDEISKAIAKILIKEGVKQSELVSQRVRIGAIVKFIAFSKAISYFRECKSGFENAYNVIKKYKDEKTYWNTTDAEIFLNGYYKFWQYLGSMQLITNLMEKVDLNYCLTLAGDILLGLAHSPINISDIKDVISLVKGYSVIDIAFKEFDESIEYAKKGEIFYRIRKYDNLNSKSNYWTNYAYILYNDLIKEESPIEKTGTLQITSNPSGAKVYINDEYKGTTPLDFTLPPGSYNITLTKEGYEDYTIISTIQSNKTTTINANLKKKSTAGTLIWRYKTGDDVYSSPTIYNGKLYIGSNDYYIYCLNTSDGSLIWKYKTGSFVESSPTIYNDKLYVGSWDNYIYCLNASDGSLIWKYKTGSFVESSPTIYNDKLYAGSCDNYIYCLNASDGSLIWKYKTGRCVGSSPTIHNNNLYVGSDDSYIYCLNASDGSLIWKYKTGSCVFSSPTIHNNNLYVGSDDSYIYCLNALDGSLIWKYETGDTVRCSPAIYNNKLYVGSWDNYIYCLNASDGSLIWRYKTGDYVDSSPTIYNGKLYVGSIDNYIYCFNASDGSLIWKYKTGRCVFSSPTIHNNNLYVGSDDSYIYCLDIGEP